jgi:hypothetical protein
MDDGIGPTIVTFVHTRHNQPMLFFSISQFTHLCIFYEKVGKQRHESDHGKAAVAVNSPFLQDKVRLFTYWLCRTSRPSVAGLLFGILYACPAEFTVGFRA